MTNLKPHMNHHDAFIAFQDRQDRSRHGRLAPLTASPAWSKPGPLRCARPLPALPLSILPLIIALLIILLLAGCGEETPKLENGQAAPAFALTDLTGKTWHLPEDLQGQVVALRFWADWCPFCAPEMRAIEPLYQELQAQGLRVLAVNVRQDRETAARFIAGLGISYATLLDEDGAVARQYGVSGLPTTYFIDRAGKIHTRILGEAAPELFAKIVREML